MKKKAISLLLVGAMVAAMVAGCGNASSNDNGAAAGGDSSAASESNSSAKSEGSKDGYTIAANIWGTGAYPLDIIVHADEKAAAVAGAKVDVADNAHSHKRKLLRCNCAQRGQERCAIQR